MARTRFVVELGMGVDLHGQDYTKSARRAVEDAIHRSSLLYLTDSFKAGKMPKAFIEVTIASPKPEVVDGKAVLEALPFGEKSIKVVAGGLEVPTAQPDYIIISNAAVLVTLESQ
jgi:uncharacterized protein (TIGR02058 family)